MKSKLLRIQGIFYLFTGIWPIIHINSFMWVTGPKTDIWLVKMIGLLSIAISLSILSAPANKKQALVLSISTAASFLVIDVYYTMCGTISKIYLADAAIELIFIVLACVGASQSKKSKSQF